MANKKNLKLPNLLTFNKSTKLWYLLFTCVPPVVTTSLILYSRTSLADWQSGNYQEYVLVFIGYPVLWYFVPFFLFSISSMLALCWNFDKFKDQLWVKIGILSGFFLSLKYFVLSYSIILSGSIRFILFPAGLVLGVFLLFWLVSWLIKKRWFKVVLLAVLMIGFILTALYDSNNVPTIFFVAVLASIFGGPVLATMFSGALSWQLWKDSLSFSKRNKQKHKQQTEALGLGLYSLIYSGVLYLAIQRTLEEYSKLPTHPPGCFLATAAANGHTSFVNSWSVETKNGLRFKVTRQLQYVRFSELVLQQLFPKFHAYLRKVYNFVGPKLARRVHSPFIADLVYLLFKPIEWFGKLVVFVWPEFQEKVEDFYMTN